MHSASPGSLSLAPHSCGMCLSSCSAAFLRCLLYLANDKWKMLLQDNIFKKLQTDSRPELGCCSELSCWTVGSTARRSRISLLANVGLLCVCVCTHSAGASRELPCWFLLAVCLSLRASLDELVLYWKLTCVISCLLSFSWDFHTGFVLVLFNSVCLFVSVSASWNSIMTTLQLLFKQRRLLFWCF